MICYYCPSCFSFTVYKVRRKRYIPQILHRPGFLFDLFISERGILKMFAMFVAVPVCLCIRQFLVFIYCGDFVQYIKIHDC